MGYVLGVAFASVSAISLAFGYLLGRGARPTATHGPVLESVAAYGRRRRYVEGMAVVSWRRPAGALAREASLRVLAAVGDPPSVGALRPIMPPRALLISAMSLLEEEIARMDEAGLGPLSRIVDGPAPQNVVYLRR